MPSIQDDNVLITRASLAKCLGKILEEKVFNILGKLGCDSSPDRIEVCHRLGRKNNSVIVKFSIRKDCQHVWSFKEDLKKLTMVDLELPGNSNLCSIATYNKHLFTIILIIHMFAFFTALLLATVNSSKTEVCAHITKLCGLKARNFTASVKYVVFLLLVT